jgi:hypothetical protein
MPDTIQQLAEEYHPYYEVLPYYVVIEKAHGTPAASMYRVQGGFDIDIYAPTKNNEMTPSPDYALGYEILQKLAQEKLYDISDSCSIEVMPFLSSFFLDAQDDFQTQAMLRIRVSHRRGLDKPYGPAEQRAKEEMEKELQVRGVRFGKPAIHSGSRQK